jgi:hypothetical protein
MLKVDSFYALDEEKKEQTTGGVELKKNLYTKIEPMTLWSALLSMIGRSRLPMIL